MKEFEFTLKFALPNALGEPENYVEALAMAGCDDAIIGIGKKGRMALQFSREESSAFKAISSAVDDVKSVIPGARLIESSPDLMGLSDIAELLGFTRQYLRKMMTTKENFPVPVHSGSTEIWHLASFLEWYRTGQNRSIDSSINEVALANMRINIEKEASLLTKAAE